MASRLDAIPESDWKERARAARYNVSAIARGAKTSRQHLRAFFLGHFGMSPKKWLDQLKVRDALPMLREGELIKQVHERLGFSHPNHLARAFRRLFGRNPGACRADSDLGSWPTFEEGSKRSKTAKKFPRRSTRKLARRKR